MFTGIIENLGIVAKNEKDALEIKKSYPTAWKIKDKQSTTIEQMKEQF